MGHQFDNMNFEAAVQQTSGGLESQESTAENDGFLSLRCILDDLQGVVERAKQKDAAPEAAVLFRESCNGGHKRLGSRRKYQPVIRLVDASRQGHDLLFAINRLHSNTRAERNPVPFVPLDRIQKDILGSARAGNDIRQEDTVIVAVRLIAENNDIKSFATLARDKVFDKACARHSITDNNQSFFSLHVEDPEISEPVKRFDVPEPGDLAGWIDLLHGSQSLHVAEVTGEGRFRMHAIFNTRIVKIAERTPA